MARISRRGKKSEEKSAEVAAYPARERAGEQKIPAALYARLSSEGRDDDTIQNQVLYLKEFVSGHPELSIYHIYADHGFTGTNFERPAFQEMMEDVQAGLIKCIIVKDLSRFGRNFVETGYYIETLLPKMNVRVVAVNDNYDSGRSSSRNDISVPVRNMVNDMYAKDISKKICASNEARRESGQYTIEKCIYGYQIDKENNQFVINPETAPVVQNIFRWFLSGVKSSEIARRLNLLEIETPMEYKYEHEFHKPLEKRQYWDSGKVRKLLTQEAYTGDRFLGMRRNRLYRNQHKQERVPREDWTIYEDDHPPLVTREDMQKALNIISSQRETYRAARERTDKINKDREGLFTSLVHCKGCGITMHHQNLKYPDGKIKPEGSIYECIGRSEIPDRCGCGLKIKDGYLQAVVAGQVQLLANQVVDYEEKMQIMQDKVNDSNPLYRLRSRIQKLSGRLEECDKSIMRLYADLSEGLLDHDDYLAMKRQYHYEKEMLTEQMRQSKEELLKQEAAIKRLKDLAKDLRPQLEHTRLTRDLVKLLIERIDVDEQLNIEIHFKCQDIYESVLREKAGDGE